jgi:hypothetical protein
MSRCANCGSNGHTVTLLHSPSVMIDPEVEVCPACSVALLSAYPEVWSRKATLSIVR